MRKLIISLIVLCACSLRVQAATSLDLAEGAPERYVVVQGDTLWTIAKRFLKDPWKWPELWKANQGQISNPNRIYPGDLLVLDNSAEEMRLKLLRTETIKVGPQTRPVPLEPKPVQTIPTHDIEPFLSKPLVIADNELADAARIVRTQENRVALGAGNIAYVHGLKKEEGDYWQLFRPGRQLLDPMGNESLGREAVYLGEAQVKQFGEVSIVNIVSSPQEIYAGDYLVPAPKAISLDSYLPHPPTAKVDARIIAAYGGLAETGVNSIVTINRGARDGIEIGHVLAIYRNLNAPTFKLRESSLWGRNGLIYDDKNPSTAYQNMPIGDRDSPLWGSIGPTSWRYKKQRETLPEVTLPNERYGLLMIFRVFDRASYALVMASERPVNILDAAVNP